MAAVYTENGGRIETDIEELSAKNKQAGVKAVVAPQLINAKMIKVEQSSEEEDSSHAEATPTKRRPETAAMDPAITIKEERIEDDEYVQIKLVDVDESLERTQNKDSDRDNESVDGDWLFRCVDCGEAFGQREAYLEHQREHIHDGPIVCLDSDAQWDDLLVSEDGGRRTLCCAICGRKFSSSRGFFTHQLKHRNQALKQEPGAEVAVTKQRLFECEDCGKTYSSIGLCLNHQRSHKQASKSVFHQLAHLKKKSFQCPTCGRCYSRASALDAHRRCHEVKLIKSRSSSTEKPLSTQEPVVENGDVAVGEEKKHKRLYECRECGRAFRTTSGLSTHQRFASHPNSSEVKLKEDTKKSFSCSECDKSFLTNTALMIHQRWHIRRAKIRSSGQSFSCEECGKVFTSLTFYEKHQRVVHSGETPAKSFLHQVCQLKKKAFECQDCGRRFSRATALQSHQLCHTDVFGDAIDKATQKPVTTPTSSSPPQKLYLCDKVKPESFAIGALVYSQDTPEANQAGEDLSCNEADDHAVVDENEIEDLIVEVVSISGSDDSFREDNEPEPVSESKTEPEMECHSNQEEKKGKVPLSQLDESPLPSESKADADREIDYEANPVHTERSPPQKTSFQCPECGRKFASASAIRCHRQWHRRPMGRAASIKNWTHNAPTQTYLKKCLFKCNECGKESTTLTSHHSHMRQHEEPKPYKSLLYQLAGLQKKNFKCEVCGMRFSRASALQSHQQHHTKQDRTHKCAHCEKAYSSYGALYNHRKTCHSDEDGSDAAVSVKKEEFNPRKTLLGPKVYHCDQCGKGFWSFGAFSQHKQNQHCAEVKEKNDPSEQLASVNGHTPSVSKRATCPICGKQFRHRGILACHMKRHRSVPQMNHTCQVCGKSYRMFACFLKHQQVHDSEGIEPPVKSFEHQIEQLEKNTYSCPDCGKRFSRAMALQFHMRSHGYETGYPFSSSSRAKAQCNLSFSSESDLLKHRSQVHSGEESAQHGAPDSKKPASTTSKKVKLKLYGCPDCSKRFYKVRGLRAHRWQMHRDSKKTVDCLTPSKSFICTACEKRYSSQGALYNHRKTCAVTKRELKSVEAVVEDPLPPPRLPEQTYKWLFKCHKCGKAFPSLERLEAHKDIAKSRPHCCALCCRGYWTETQLQQHLIWHDEVRRRLPADLRYRLSTFSAPTEVGPNSEDCATQCPLDTDQTATSTTGTQSPIDYKCPHCEETFLNFLALQQHQMNIHSIDEPYRCSLCPRTFSQIHELIDHHQECLSEKKEQNENGGDPVLVDPPRDGDSLTCIECGITFGREVELHQHYIEHARGQY
ncbi:hypothetical protein SKAU_G00417350 [Synaphobranchus kaupii]|uniref:C2H2-type domain-containing protein n=1 Tax=Synaphobranchus kaupii TaxID=118154 RepID=A0A9Q1E601_SYNKA|nr:hypothetical protein SKAU_G00417350 [Synaphobranchus kaupii]